ADQGRGVRQGAGGGTPRGAREPTCNRDRRTHAGVVDLQLRLGEHQPARLSLDLRLAVRRDRSVRHRYDLRLVIDARDVVRSLSRTRTDYDMGRPFVPGAVTSVSEKIVGFSEAGKEPMRFEDRLEFPSAPP